MRPQGGRDQEQQSKFPKDGTPMREMQTSSFLGNLKISEEKNCKVQLTIV